MSVFSSNIEKTLIKIQSQLWNKKKNSKKKKKRFKREKLRDNMLR